MNAVITVGIADDSERVVVRGWSSWCAPRGETAHPGRASSELSASGLALPGVSRIAVSLVRLVRCRCLRTGPSTQVGGSLHESALSRARHHRHCRVRSRPLTRRLNLDSPPRHKSPRAASAARVEAGQELAFSRSLFCMRVCCVAEAGSLRSRVVGRERSAGCGDAVGRQLDEPPEAGAIGTRVWPSGKGVRHFRAMTVEDCIEARVVARRHAKGHDAHGNPVGEQVRSGARRVIKKLDCCLTALAAEGVPGANEALAAQSAVAERPVSRNNDAGTSLGSDEAESEVAEPRAWVVRAGREGEKVRHNLDNGLVTIEWDSWDAIRDVPEFATRTDFGEFIEQHFGHRQTPGERRSARDRIWCFYHEVRVGDVVVLPLKRHGRLTTGSRSVK